MSPNDAAELLGVSTSAAPETVQRAYEARLAEAGEDVQRRDAVTAAREALLAASAWQAPGAGVPPVAQSPVSTPQPPAWGAAPAWYPVPPARRGLSTGAIVGITLGGIAAGLVILLVAVFAIGAVSHGTSRLADGQSSSAPYGGSSGAPSAVPSPGETGVDDYDVDGVHVHYVDGWTFELTPGQTCATATVTAGFSDTPDGDELEQWTTTIDLEAGVPYSLTIPDSASLHQYAGIDTVDCGQA